MTRVYGCLFALLIAAFAVVVIVVIAQTAVSLGARCWS